MADSENTDSTGDNPEQAVESETTKQTSETDSTATGDKETKPESEATPEEKAKPDASEVSFDEILERDDVKRTIQSERDRATAAEQKRAGDEYQRRERAASDKAERERVKKLRDEDDYDQIGRDTANKIDFEERTKESLRQAGDIISQVTIERYNRELGDEAVERIRSETENRGGSIVDFGYNLAEEKSKRERDKAVKESSSTLRGELKEDMDALRAELGVKARSDATAKGETPVKDISGGSSSPQTSEEETWETATDKFNAGEWTEDEYAPFREARNKEKRK